MQKPPTCPYCAACAVLVNGDTIYPENARLRDRRFWLCRPCDAWVSVYESSPTLKPTGRLANAELRKAKREFHGAFDVLWMVGFDRLTRVGSRASKHDCISVAYKWLAERMAINVRDCNVGAFDVARCKQAALICNTLGNELLHRFQATGEKA